MILDSGVCTVFKKANVAGFGEKPRFVNQPFYMSWYKELSFATSAADPTGRREEVEADARVRVLQNRQITNHDCVSLAPSSGESRQFEVVRAYHGQDDDSGELITDLTLRLLTP